MNKWTRKERRGRGASQQQRSATDAAEHVSRPSPLSRGRPPAGQGHAPRAFTGAPATDSGGASAAAGAATGNQPSVREMITRIDRNRSQTSRSLSPTKRQRVSRDQSPDSASGSDALTAAQPSSQQLLGSAQPLTEAALTTALNKLAERMKSDISEQFALLRNEMERLHSRVYELEQHVSARDDFINELEGRIYDRDKRISKLEEQLDDVDAAQRRPDLIFAGDAVPPPPPTERWNEDVVGTAVTFLGRCMPDVPVSREDVADARREANHRIVVRFKTAAKHSVRHRLYEERFKSKPIQDEGSEVAAKKLFVNENLTAYRHAVFMELRKKKAEKRIHCVFSKDGEVFCKLRQHGRKTRVPDFETLRDLLRDT